MSTRVPSPLDPAVPSTPYSISFLIPAFNDWDSVEILLTQLDEVMSVHREQFEVLIVDDGSFAAAPEPLPTTPLTTISRVDVLRLKRNLGHQRALAIGLAFLEANRSPNVVIVMDGDGEDRPQDLPLLLEKFAQEHSAKVIFAGRLRRSEGLVFAGFYHLYRGLHRLLTGIPVRIGNFSVIPGRYLASLSVAPELWNHYAAAVVKMNLPHAIIAVPKGSRYHGTSRMSFVNLVVHGLGAISVFSDIMGVRLLVATLFGIGLGISGLLVVMLLRLFTSLAVPGWATSATGLLLVILLEVLLGACVLVFIILSLRAQGGFLPIRDYRYFVATIRRVDLRSER